jgi:hypothetical protein
VVRRVSLGEVLFVLYCVEAGVLLTLLPWTASWNGTLLRLPDPGVLALTTHPLLRGAVSGFGLVHLLWGAHDLDLLLSRRRRG